MITTLGLAPMLFLMGGMQILPMAAFVSVTASAFGLGVS